MHSLTFPIFFWRSTIWKQIILNKCLVVCSLCNTTSSRIMISHVTLTEETLPSLFRVLKMDSLSASLSWLTFFYEFKINQLDWSDFVFQYCFDFILLSLVLRSLENKRHNYPEFIRQFDEPAPSAGLKNLRDPLGGAGLFNSPINSVIT